MANVGVQAQMEQPRASGRKFSSKVLILGEYSIIKNSMALATPYQLFDGELVFVRNGDSQYGKEKFYFGQQELKAFARYIEKVLIQPNPLFTFDMTSFKFDIELGLYFSSSIPAGQGLGSSGALCSAVFDRYGKIINPSKDDSILQLRDIFALLESYFHGKSSGLDPLISYLNGPLLIKSKQVIEKVVLPTFPEDGKGGLFLLSSGRPRKTGPLVNLFLELCERKEFWLQCEERLIPATNWGIESFLKGDLDSFQRSYEEISRFQLEYFQKMIPEEYQDVWRDGGRSKDYTLKLCGAGGGGFLLGMTRDLEKVKQIFHEQSIRVLFKF
jgi:mevalonate kinase